MTTAHTATLKLKLKSTSGYSEDSTYTNVTPEKFGRVVRVLNDMDAQDDLVNLVKDAQSILAAHLPPDGVSNDEAMRQLLGLLDGPQSRAALAKAGV